MFWPTWDWISKYWTSPDLSYMRWLGLFTNKTFRKHRKLIFPHRDFIICIVSLAIFHPHFSVLHPPSAIRSALYRDPVIYEFPRGLKERNSRFLDRKNLQLLKTLWKIVIGRNFQLHSRQEFNWENEKCCLNKSSKASVSTSFWAFIGAFLKGYIPIWFSSCKFR